MYYEDLRWVVAGVAGRCDVVNGGEAGTAGRTIPRA